MAVSTPQEITQYLKQASELELSVYSQTKAEANARSNLKRPTIAKGPVTYKEEKSRVQEPKAPQKSSVAHIEKPTIKKVEIDYGFWTSKACAYVFVAGLVGVFLSVVILILNSSFWMVDGVFVGCAVCAPVLLFFLVGFAMLEDKQKKKIEKKAHDQATEAYNKERELYDRKVAEAEETAEKEYATRKKNYEKELLEYYKEKKRVEKINAERYSAAVDKVYKAAEEKADKTYAEAKSKVNELTTTLHETEAVLAKLYAVDVIFPKYRNMAAMCTMYEYFASGRCSELSGPDGAYNLYESELRQNVIIGQLEKINENLEQIKGNQYVLYQGIMECNKSIQTVSDEVTRMSGTLQRVAASNAELVRNSERIAGNTAVIAQNSEITAHYAKLTAYCSQITAKNTEAIKYISLING